MLDILQQADNLSGKKPFHFYQFLPKPGSISSDDGLEPCRYQAIKETVDLGSEHIKYVLPFQIMQMMD